jgi:Ca-activated chloride channel family protein
VVFATALATACGGDGDGGGLRATNALVRTVRQGVSIETGGAKALTLDLPARLARGDAVRTDESGRAAIELDAGAFLFVDGGTELGLVDDGATLAAGRVWVDAPAGAGVRVATPFGFVFVRSSGVDVRVRPDGASVHVVQGEALVSANERRTLVRAGQTADVDAGGARVDGTRLWEDWTFGLAVPGPRSAAPVGVGTISARVPGAAGEARWPLVVRRLDVRVTIREDLAITEVDELFFNPASETVEGLYRLRIPEGAVLQRFAVDRDGALVDAIVRERRQARTSYEEQVYEGSTDDPALLEWDGPGSTRARLYPIAPGSTRRVVTRWTEWIGSASGVRTLRYPIGRGPRLQELSIEVDLAEANAGDVRVGLGARRIGDRVVLRASDVQPRADFWLELAPGPRAPGAVAYRAPVRPAPALASVRRADADDRDALLVRVDPPSRDIAWPKAIDLVVLFDLSAGTDSTRLELGRRVVESLIGSLGPRDRLAVVGSDLGVRPLAPEPPQLAAATAAVREAILEALARAPLGGATDLGAALTGAAELLEAAPSGDASGANGRRAGAVVYVGDAIPTVGEIDLTALQRRLDRLARPLRLFGVGVGAEAQLTLLEGLAGPSGRALRVETAREAGMAALQILEHLARPVLQEVTAELDGEVDRVYPSTGQTFWPRPWRSPGGRRRPPPMPAGQPLQDQRVVARRVLERLEDARRGADRVQVLGARIADRRVLLGEDRDDLRGLVVEVLDQREGLLAALRRTRGTGRKRGRERGTGRRPGRGTGRRRRPLSRHARRRRVSRGLRGRAAVCGRSRPVPPGPRLHHLLRRWVLERGRRLRGRRGYVWNVVDTRTCLRAVMEQKALDRPPQVGCTILPQET